MHVGIDAPLLVGQVVQADNRRSVDSELLQRHHAAVALDDFGLTVLVVPDGDGVAVAELADALGDLVDLLLGMLLGVVRIWHEVGDRHLAHFQFRHGSHGRSSRRYGWNRIRRVRFSGSFFEYLAAPFARPPQTSNFA